MTTVPIPRGRHGVRRDGQLIHRFGCFPRAISICFGRRLQKGYAAIVKACYAAAARCEGSQFDFDRPRGGLYDCCIRSFCLLHGLRFIDLDDRPQPLKPMAGLWPTSVFITADHAVPVRDGVQFENPFGLKTARVYAVVTTYSGKPFAP